MTPQEEQAELQKFINTIIKRKTLKLMFSTAPDATAIDIIRWFNTMWDQKNKGEIKHNPPHSKREKTKLEEFEGVKT